MAAPTPPKTLFFVAPIYARGEHIIGEKALTDDGHINMVNIRRGETRKIDHAVAIDLIIAKQALDTRTASAADLADAKEFVAARNKADEDAARKATEDRTEEKSLRLQLEELRKEVIKLKKAA